MGRIEQMQAPSSPAPPAVALNSVMVTAADLFPTGINQTGMDMRRTRFYELLEALILEGVSNLYVLDVFRPQELTRTVYSSLPHEFSRFVHVVSKSDCDEQLRNARYFVNSLDISSFTDPESTYEVIPTFMECVVRQIFFFLVAQKLKIQLPARASNYAKTVSELRRQLKPGPGRARLTLIESIFNSYREHPVPTVRADNAGWIFLRELCAANCETYSSTFRNLGRHPMKSMLVGALQKSVELMNHPGVQLISTVVDILVPKVFANTKSKLESTLEVLTDEGSSKYTNADYYPVFIGEVPPLELHYRTCHNDLSQDYASFIKDQYSGRAFR